MSVAKGLMNAASRGVARFFTTGSRASCPLRPIGLSSCVPRPGASGSRLPWAPSGGGGRGGGGRSIRMASSGGSEPSKRSGGLWGKYLELLDAQPLLTRCVTCAILNGLGDVFCQLYVEKVDFSQQRFLTFTLLGLLYVGPILATWYATLGSLVTAPGTTGVIISLLVDQFLFAPAFIASFMSVMCLIERKPEKIVPKLKQDLPEALKVNWLLWIPAQFINFKFVPPNLRVLAVNIVALLWNVYMSYQSHKAVAAPTPVTVPAAAVKTGKGKK